MAPLISYELMSKMANERNTEKNLSLRVKGSRDQGKPRDVSTLL